MANPSNNNLEDKTSLKSEIDNIPLVNLDLANIIIAKIEARKEQKFKDPFTYNVHNENE